MRRKWHNPPNWDACLDEAIEEVNALAPAAMDIFACPAEPERFDPSPPLWFGVIVMVGCGLLIGCLVMAIVTS